MNFVNRASSAKTEQGEEALEVEIRELARRDNGDADLVNDDAKLASNNLGTLMRRMSLTSTREIDSLMSELKALRQKVVIDGDRVERQLAEYAELNQSVTRVGSLFRCVRPSAPEGEGVGTELKWPLRPKRQRLAGLVV